jgi:hypothetical protein
MGDGSKAIVGVRHNIRTRLTIYMVATVIIIVWSLYKQSWSADLGICAREFLICLGFAILGSTIPRIHVTGTLRRVVYASLIAADLILIPLAYYEVAAMIGAFAMLPNVLKPRQKHYGPYAILRTVVLPVPILFITVIASGRLGFRQLGVSYYVATVAGYMGHIIAEEKG